MFTSLRKWGLYSALAACVSFTANLNAGTVTGAYQTVPQGSEVNLTQEGALDWIHWGTFTEFASDRKAAVTPLISEYTLVGNPIADYGPFQFSDNFNGYTWYDGLPDIGATNSTTGIYLLGKNNGFQFIVPADTTTRVLKVYVGAFGAGATFNATLSDGGSYSSSAISYAANGPSGLYTVIYTALSSNQTLTVKFTTTTIRDRTYANVTLQAAALSFATTNNPPTVVITSPAQSASFVTGDPISITANTFDPDGSVTNVQFFAGTNFLGQASEAPFSITWTAATIGRYSITAQATDNNGATRVSSPVALYVTGTDGYLVGSVSNTAAAVVLSAEGTRDWAHWGLAGANAFDHKSGVPAVIPNFIKIGTNAVAQKADDFTSWSWADGTPTITATNSKTGVYIIGYTNGFELRIPAAPIVRTVTVYCGLYGMRGRVEAYLSDFSAPAFDDISRQSFYGNARGAYKFDFSSASENQTLVVRYTSDAVFDSIFGSINLLAATIVALPPSVAIVAPFDGDEVDYSKPVLIQTSAENPDGPIKSVDFYANNVLIGTSTNSPFRLLWNDLNPGPYVLTAVAKDLFGGVATSAPVSLTLISNPPPIEITRPTSGDTFVAGTNVYFEAINTDPNFDVQSVEFFANDVSLGGLESPPYGLVWENAPVGFYRVIAVATDSEWNIVASIPIYVSVEPNKPPSVSFETPTNGAVYHLSAPVAVTAKASDKDGYITLLEIFEGDTKLTECAGPSCAVVLSNDVPRTYTLTARATDNWLATSTSSPIVVTITNLPPSVVLNHPTNGSVLWTGMNINLAADPIDPDGTIQSVKFFEGTNLLGEITTSPYSMSWSNVLPGTYSLTATTTDNDGESASSAAAEIIVSNPAPTVSISAPLAGALFPKFTNILVQAIAGDVNGTVTNVTFFQGTNVLGIVTNSSTNLNEPFSLVWSNVAPGTYTITAVATDNEGATEISQSVTFTVANSYLVGSLTGSLEFISQGTEINLSKEGALDWVHWGTYTEFASDHKAGAVSLIGDYSLLGNPAAGDGPFRYGDNFNGYSWINGTPDTVVSNTTSGVYLSGTNHGFQLVLPSDITTRVLKIYLGAYGADAEFTATVSDGGSYSSSEIGYDANGPAGVYTLVYSSATSNQLLTVRFLLRAVRNSDFANITLQAAALSYGSDDNNPPVAGVASPTDGASFGEGNPVSLAATAFDDDGTITNVEFFAGTNLIGQVSEAPFSTTWSNAIRGQYALTVKATDNHGATATSLPVTVYITGVNGSLNGSEASTPGSVVLSVEGTRDWIHWGRNGANSIDRKSGVAAFLPNFQKIGPSAVQAVSDVTGWSWTGGTPLATASNSTTGIAISGLGNGFELQLPASTLSRTARIYVGASSAQGRLQAYLSDFSAPAFADTSVKSLYGNSSGVFTFNYAAASNNQKLIVRYTSDSFFDPAFGMVNLLSATAIAGLSTVAITSPTDGATVDCTTPPQIQANASNPDGAVQSLAFYQNGSLIGVVTNSPFNITWSNAIPGAYTLTAVAVDVYGGVSTSAPVAVTLIGNPLPVVSITTPTAGSTLFENTNVTISAQASDLNGTIASVEFFAGPVSLGQLSAPPFALVWSNVPLGTYSLTAVATDNDGGSTTSAPVNLTVVSNKLPTVTVTAPANNATILVSSNVTVTATASDVDGNITQLELFADSGSLVQSASSPLSFTWTNPPVGTHILTARAVDNWFGTNVSSTVTINVTNPPPTVAITNPVNGATLIEHTNLTIRARASDTNGTIAMVEFFEGTNLLGQVTNSPFALVWSNLTLGSYALTAKATDNLGASTLSSAVNVTVVTNRWPTVNITAPTNNTTVIASSNVTVNATASDTDGNITQLEIFTDSVSVAQSASSPLSFVWTNPPVGTHILTARAVDNWFGTNVSSTVTINVTNPPPTVAITNPVNGATLIEHTNLTIRARASDTNGTIAMVEFFEGTNLLGQVTNPPFALVWSNLTAGSYALTAKATDNLGASTLSSAVNVTVVTNRWPTVNITAPTNNTTVIASSNVTINAMASDTDGNITQLEIFADSVSVAQSASSPLSFVWTNPPTGTHTLTARAVDNLLGTNISSVVTINVTNPPPTVAITNPVNGATLIEHTNLTIRARASDTNGTIAMVEFFEGTNSLGQVTNPPFAITWNNLALGSYVLTAQATDNLGASIVSSVVNITVVTNRWPAVNISTPINGAAFFTSSNVTVTATASDSDGTITLLQIFEGDTSIAQSASSPLTYVLTNPAPGTHTFSARATDNWNDSTTSSEVTITITNPAPSISITNPLDGAFAFAGTNITLRAKATDSNGPITLVEFLVGNNLLGQVTNSPYDLVWSNVDLGSYSVTARATDRDGAATTSAPINISVVTNQWPTVILTAPTNGAKFYTTSKVTITSTASDPDGNITLHELFDGPTKLAQSTGPSLSFIWTNPPAGTHTLTTRATDNWFGTNTSSPVTILVDSIIPPTVNIVAPTNGESYYYPTTLVITASASTNEGGTSIKLLEVYDGSIRLTSASNVTALNYTWSPALGNHTLTARATDNRSVSNISPATIVSIGYRPPTVTVTSPTNNTLFSLGSSITINATATSPNGTISKVQFYAGSTLLGQSTKSPYKYAWSGASAGSYALTAVATDSAGATNRSAPVNVVVTNRSPSVSITNPISDAILADKTNIIIKATASDPDGTISKVEFFSGATRLGQVTASPYNFTWTNVAAGNYTLTAIATDNGGASNTSAEVSIYVTNLPPSISITNPVNGASFDPNTNITIKATAVDPNGPVALVEFYQGTNKLGQVTNSPYNFTWTNVPLGVYQLTAVGTDTRGASATSAVVNITVASNVLPTTGITSPTNGALLMITTNLSITATGTDSDGIITLLEIYDSTNKLAQTTNSGALTFLWTNAATGQHTLTSRCKDNRGGSVTSSPVVVTLTNPPPFVVLTSPTNGAKFATKSKITISATATDTNGTVTKVAFYQGTTLLNTDTSSPFSYLWSNVASGSYTLTAVATDNNGATNKSAAISITVGTVVATRVVTDTGPKFTFAVPTEPGANYIIESASTLDVSDWQSVTNFVGTGQEVIISEPISGDQQHFYRIIESD